ncbi:ROK family protein [Georgenia deserti]|uniref:ROK family protein n=1 Tax=Georgenia deserti TaxID=2093781 RepID=A0ABW4L7W0_9MICO
MRSHTRDDRRTDPALDDRAPATASWVAVDIGGTHVTSATVRPDLEITDERRLPLDAEAPADELLDAMADAIRVHGALTAPVAMAIPGPFDYRRGIGDFTGVAKFGALYGVDVRAGLAQRCGREPGFVHFINDADAFGLGEWAAGAGQRSGRCIAITLGTGIGSAFVDRGHCVSTGDAVPRDGDIHTVRIDGVPLEERVSRRALRAAYLDRTGHTADVAEIAERARSGEPEALGVLEAGMRVLARAFAPWCEAFGAERLVVGGSMVASADLLFPPFRAALAALLADPPTVAPRLLKGEQAALLGAVLGADPAAADRLAGRAPA